VRLLLTILLLLLPAADAKTRSTPRVHRSSEARREFQREHPCPSTGEKSGACPGYVRDHIVPLACGGADSPANMQWQTVEEGKAKDTKLITSATRFRSAILGARSFAGSLSHRGS
jgi:5-methylcytosine-specific restriction endonuclease McrA